MENKKQLTEAEIDLMFERLTDNITVGDPKDMVPFVNVILSEEDIIRIKSLVQLRQLRKDFRIG
jgi:hypothetical protein